MMTKTKTLTTKITRTRRPLATARGARGAALTALLTLVPLGLALGAVSVAPATAWAASGSCSPALGGQMAAWIFTPAQAGAPAEVTFTSATGGVVSIGFPPGATLPDQTWGTMSNPVLDDPAPLTWWHQHYTEVSSVNNLADIFGPCQQYTPALVAKMTSDHFAPSTVGGVNPPGVTAVNVGTTSPSTPTQTTTKTQTPPSTTPTKPSQTTTTTSPVSTPTTTTTPQYPTTLTQSGGGGAPVAGHLKQIQEILSRDQQSIADGGGKSPRPSHPSSAWPYIVAGVALIVGVIVVLVRRNRHPGSVDQINTSLGGRRNF